MIDVIHLMLGQVSIQQRMLWLRLGGCGEPAPVLPRTLSVRRMVSEQLARTNPRTPIGIQNFCVRGYAEILVGPLHSNS